MTLLTTVIAFAIKGFLLCGRNDINLYFLGTVLVVFAMLVMLVLVSMRVRLLFIAVGGMSLLTLAFVQAVVDSYGH